MKSHCSIYFRSEHCDLESAIKSLERYRIKVTKDGEKLLVGRESSPEYQVVLNDDDSVHEEAKDISQGTEFFNDMKQCDTRFDVLIVDLDAALEEINTLMEVQGALQDASKGFLFLPWNGHISRPWEG